MINAKGILILIFFIFLGIFPTQIVYAQDYQEVTAQNGEGIYALLRRYNFVSHADYDRFLALNAGRLGKNNTLLAGQKYLLPLSSVTGAYPIFGAAYAEVKILDQALSGAVYYLVSGHGGPDPGAVGKVDGKTVSEDEYAYDITLRLARKLVEHSALVYMIIRDNTDGIRNDRFLPLDTDEVCYPDLSIPLDVNARLRQRVNAVNQLYRSHRAKGRNYQRCVVIHVDSRTRGQNIDVFFYHHQHSKSGKQLAMQLKKTFKAKYDRYQPGRGYTGTVSHRNLYMVRKTDPTAVYIELGNINNARDQRRFLDSDNREALAKWLYEGLYADFKKP